MENKFRSYVLSLPRFLKKTMVIYTDIGMVILSVWLAFYFRTGEPLSVFRHETNYSILPAILIALSLSIPIFLNFGLYKMSFRFSGVFTILKVGKAVLLYTVLYASIIVLIRVDGVPRTIGLIQPMVLFLLIGSTRGLARLLLDGVYRPRASNKKVFKTVIYGAGSAGQKLNDALASDQSISIVGFLDDDRSLHGSQIDDVIVYAPESIKVLKNELHVEQILLAMPRLNRDSRTEVLKKLHKHNLIIRTIPSLSELANGRQLIHSIRDLSVDDFLGRDAIEPDLNLMKSDIAGNSVMVSGAGGSIGSELCKQIIRYSPEKIILVDHCEFALYSILSEIESLANSLCLKIDARPVLGSVSDKAFLQHLFKIYEVQTVYHAAAYKHVPLVEANLIQGIKNNIIGTFSIAQIAIDAKVKKFVLVSTDKAVRPTNIMGASKRVAELILQALSVENHSTIFSLVRFGNVLNSSGSVVPLFQKQIEDGGPVTVTHPEVTRYFMTIAEAAQLIIQAGALASKDPKSESAPIYLLDMGEPIKILQLAKRMIELNDIQSIENSAVKRNIEIIFSGLRPGEKLFEELLIDDVSTSTIHPKIKRAREKFIPWNKLKGHLNKLEKGVSNADPSLIKSVLEKIVDGYPNTNATIPSTNVRPSHKNLK
jgi:FlaA1/EpsC-like NDP-sugar epimerase